ncbi:hypothetical protein IF1G_09973 [Cordyceps javanica]|uniref:Uncharacterized protein n=1 Tax=Cordyceps javanica TaxID=43265 RepID=A0A545UPT2_9HYPO|nr:hypothetical protein IF1G_09973 [Cordyceps javanica]TQW03111.1 hypothetical protein IF2G_09244 [Cordyceps javanica]
MRAANSILTSFTCGGQLTANKADTKQRLRKGRFTSGGGGGSARPDSPRPGSAKMAPASSRPWSRYPPRTAETRNMRPNQHRPRLRQQQQQQQQQQPQQNPPPRAIPLTSSADRPRDGRAAPAAVRKRVSFHGAPCSSSTTSSASDVRLPDATGPARERRRRARLRDVETPRCCAWTGALRACMSKAWGGSSAGFKSKAVPDAARVPAPRAPAAQVCRCRHGQTSHDTDAPHHDGSPPARPCSSSSSSSGSSSSSSSSSSGNDKDPPYPILPRKYTLLGDSAGDAAPGDLRRQLARYPTTTDVSRQLLLRPESRSVAGEQSEAHFRVSRRKELEWQKRRYWV